MKLSTLSTVVQHPAVGIHLTAEDLGEICSNATIIVSRRLTPINNSFEARQRRLKNFQYEWPVYSKADRSGFSDLDTPLPGCWQEPASFSFHYINTRFEKSSWLINEAAPEFSLRCHPRDHRWVRSKARHDTDPNYECGDRFPEGVSGSGGFQSVDTTAEVVSHNRVNPPKGEATILDFGPNRPEIHERAEAMSNLRADYEANKFDEPYSEELVNLYEELLKYEFEKDWEEQHAEAIKIRDGVWADSEGDDLWRAKLLRSADVFLPPKPRCAPEINGIKTQGLKKGVRYLDSAVQERIDDYSDVSGDETNDTGLPEGAILDFGRRETQNPIVPIEATQIMKVTYGGLTPAEIRSTAIFEQDATDFVKQIENISDDNIAAYKGTTSEGVKSRRKRRKREVLEVIKTMKSGACTVNGNCIALTQFMRERGNMISSGFYFFFRVEGQERQLIPLEVKNREEASEEIEKMYEARLRQSLQRRGRRSIDDVTARWTKAFDEGELVHVSRRANPSYSMA